MTYPLPILNELHEEYPDILYRPSRFQTSSDVLNYIIEQSIYRPYRQEVSRYHTEQAQIDQREQLEQRIQNLESIQNSQDAQRPQHIQSVPPVRGRSAEQHEIEELEREMYDGSQLPAEVVTTIPLPISQTTSMEQLLSFLIDDGLFHSRNRQPTLRPTSQQLQRSTTINTLSESYDGVCSICHDAMLSGQHVRRINHCNHLFHQLCIDTWFAQRSTCPTCRHDIRT